MKKKSSINNLLSLGLGDESVNYRDQYQLKLLKKYANFAYYMKLMDSLYHYCPVISQTSSVD